MHAGALRGYALYLRAELAAPVNYIIAVGIGAAILLLQGAGLFTSPVPYVVPVLVQAFSKSYIRFRARHTERLLSLPAEREDPAFIMDRGGAILLSSGKTQKLFADAGVQSLGDLLREDDARRILEEISAAAAGAGHSSSVPLEFEGYSPLTERWYAVKISIKGGGEDVLVWLRDITSYRHIDDALSRVREYGDQLIGELPRLVERDTSLERLAPLFLSLGYEGVFIARTDDNQRLSGQVYKPGGGEMVCSDPITVSRESSAPIWASRRSDRVVYAEQAAGESEKEFLSRYPVDRRVREFLGGPVRNFVNYHEGAVSVIAFNMERSIVSRDLVAMEVLVNSARSVTTLVGYARQNERRFLQAVHGVCAAAEFSDEITGRHIWRVNEYARMLAADLGFSKEGQKNIGQVAAMHDIGKIAIPEIIKLDRKLTAEEREQMEMHTVIGARIIDAMLSCCGDSDERLTMAREIAIAHHQCWDGSGYPRFVDEQGQRHDPLGLSRQEYHRLRPLAGEEIPLSARIVALADAYDALRSKRQYKPSFSHEKVAGIIRRDDRSGLSSAERFGPDLAELFEQRQGRMAEIFSDFSD